MKQKKLIFSVAIIGVVIFLVAAIFAANPADETDILIPNIAIAIGGILTVIPLIIFLIDKTIFIIKTNRNQTDKHQFVGKGLQLLFSFAVALLLATTLELILSLIYPSYEYPEYESLVNHANYMWHNLFFWSCFIVLSGILIIAWVWMWPSKAKLKTAN